MPKIKFTQIPKIKCNNCSSVAEYFYPKSEGEKHSRAYCEDCVPREGCDCLLEEDGSYQRDSLGRILPCVDYMYFEGGVEAINGEDSVYN